MRIRGLEFPDELYYHAGHMVWLRQHGPDRLVLGVTSLLLATAGEVLLFVPKAPGWQVDRDRSVGNIETGKLVAAVRTPVAGRLVVVHEALAQGAIAVNRDPYGTWFVEIEPSDWDRDQSNLLAGPSAWRALEAEMDAHDYGGSGPR